MPELPSHTMVKSGINFARLATLMLVKTICHQACQESHALFSCFSSNELIFSVGVCGGGRSWKYPQVPKRFEYLGFQFESPLPLVYQDSNSES